MDWLQWKYANLLGPQLPNFKVKSNRLINCSCPFCDEAHTSHKKRPMRGYILDGREMGVYFCHRCGISMSVPSLLKRLDESLYADYIKEKLCGRNSGVELVPSKHSVESSILSVRSIDLALRTVQKISRLPKDHFARRYVENRRIPDEYQKSLYFTPKFMTWVNTIIPDKFSEEALALDEPRLVIPFFNRAGKLHAVQGRSLDPLSKGKIRYIAIAIDRNFPVMYGLDKYNPFQMGFVTEGPIDSMFLRNSLAACGSDLASKLKDFEKDKITIVYDNEPRKPETVAKIEKAIREGFSVVIWPTDIEEKDINELILSGRTSEEIEDMLLTHSFSGISAEFELKRWRRV